MNILPGPIAERDLETLIGLERVKYTEFGFAEHQQGVRDDSAQSGNRDFPEPPLRRKESRQLLELLSNPPHLRMLRLAW